MNQLLYLAIVGTAGGAIGLAMATVAQRMPGRIYRGWVKECADVLAQADQLDGIANLKAEQAERAKAVGIELEAAIANPATARASVKRSATLASLLALLFMSIAHAMPPSPAAVAWMAFAAWIVMMSAVDWDSTLLPDVLTIPLIWAGLMASWAGVITVSLQDAVAGAVAGYASLRFMYEGHKAITGQEGMGHGDFKLLAAIGAWLGWQSIVPVLIMASLSGLVASAIAKLTKTRREGGIIPFGPFLGASALLVVVLGVPWPLRHG